MTITIKYIPMHAQVTNGDLANPEVNITFFPPEPAVKYYLENFKDHSFAKCPAFMEYFKNCFVIKAPYDLEIKLENGKVSTNIYDQKWFDQNIKVDRHPTLDAQYLQTVPGYVFIPNTKKSVMLYSSGLPFSDHAQNNEFITGAFDISKWVRPVGYAVKIQDNTIVKFYRGQPLYMVRFICDDKIELEFEAMTLEIKHAVDGCVRLKTKIKRLNLRNMYDMADNFVTVMKKRIFKE
jgi:hypothetical protein